MLSKYNSIPATSILFKNFYNRKSIFYSAVALSKFNMMNTYNLLDPSGFFSGWLNKKVNLNGDQFQHNLHILRPPKVLTGYVFMEPVANTCEKQRCICICQIKQACPQLQKLPGVRIIAPVGAPGYYCSFCLWNRSLLSLGMINWRIHLIHLL